MRAILAALCLALCALIATSAHAAPERPAVVHARIDDQPITPVTARYLRRVQEHAEEIGAAALLIELDTPGGLVSSTRRIVQGIVASRVPVVVYVAPRGARAASAGLFLTLAAHVAAMAPVTHLGAAHPVSIGATPLEEDGARGERSPSETKIVNDTRAWARALAELRGRNADWAERAVSESLTLTAGQAVEHGVIDRVASDPRALLDAVDGSTVELAGGPRVLRTMGAELVPAPMGWGERALAVLAHPNVAFLLLLFGFYGLLFELYAPGWGISGTLGVVFLVLGLAGLAVLPVNLAGLALLGVALALFVAEAWITSYGVLTIAGAVCLVLGGLMLVDSPPGFLRVTLWVVLPMALATALITFFLLTRVLSAHRARVLTGTEGMLAETAVAVGDFEPRGRGFAGTVRVLGELWSARSRTPVERGSEVRVAGRRGLTLEVRDAATNGQEART